MDISEKLFELADRLKALRDEKKETEQRVKDIGAELDEVDAALVQLMTDTETQNFTRSGIMFCLTNTTRASATADRRWWWARWARPCCGWPARSPPARTCSTDHATWATATRASTRPAGT